MEFGFTFDADQVELSERPAGEYRPIPSGTKVQLQCIEAELKPTRNGMGIALKHQVIAGEYEGKWVKDFINVQNTSHDCQRIGNEQLARLCKSMGRQTAECTEDLLYQPFHATVKVEPGDIIAGTNPPERYPAKNKIKTYLTGSEIAPAKQAQPAPAQASAAPARQARPANAPWPRRPAA